MTQPKKKKPPAKPTHPVAITAAAKEVAARAAEASPRSAPDSPYSLVGLRRARARRGR